MEVGSELEMARESYAVAYVTAACATTLLFDYFLTLGDEIRRMWSAPMSVPKALFLADRYVVMPMLVFNGIASTRNHLSADVCVFYLRWLVVCITVTNACVECILLKRVIALYRDNAVVVWGSSLLYTAGILTLVGITIEDYVKEAVNIVEDFSALPGCYAASVPRIIAGYWIVSTIVESVFFLLVIYRVIVWSRDNVEVPRALILMARDSSVYFTVIFALLILNLFVFEFAPPFLSSLFVTPANTAGCIAGARMLMNLRAMRDSHFAHHHPHAGRAGARSAGSPETAWPTDDTTSADIELGNRPPSKSTMQFTSAARGQWQETKGSSSENSRSTAAVTATDSMADSMGLLSVGSVIHPAEVQSGGGLRPIPEHGGPSLGRSRRDVGHQYPRELTPLVKFRDV